MALKIYGDGSNKNAAKALIVGEFIGVKIETLPVEWGVTQKTPEFQKMNPIQKIPVLVTPEGGIFESNAIARYVARTKDQMLGSTLYEKGLVDQWCDFAVSELDHNLLRWIYPKMGYTFMPTAPNVEEGAVEASKRALGSLNTWLTTRTYLVGNSITVADVVIFCNILVAVRTVIDKQFLGAFPHVERYFWTMANQPQVKKVVGEFTFGDKLTTQSPAAAAPAAAKEASPAKKTKAPPAPKEAAPAPAPAAADDDEEVAAPKKSKNALDLLPPSPMVLDNWKRLYSNTKAKDFAEVAIKGFWEMYDPEGYSLWFCDYKYNEENQISYVTLNKVGGFLQRMDFIRKYAFGKMCILGDGPFAIKGVWLFRGTDIPQLVKDECYDMDLYEWTKVDISDAAQKERVSAMFEEPDLIDGEKLLEAKCFK
ncbi:glutathione S-transferase [Marchantia polymorpha subsp. ruderalis]|uniref:Uncharacterized protein n=2 Tax=Marchantia polymorpha TaxID=3197 RepID=A0AAF6BVZ3_MARPO|nr:hypothetical protein MARPO_0062s0115 [Marchantia polymorpha]BBN16177.1 hypothetical protein Mp_7g04100 [Marchantia polymorpha subsp. ruderalis]|eukprot:PTQ36705.1 hypothetical protein MARPO_0062s0115 [Marchantia polymorpha]